MENKYTIKTLKEILDIVNKDNIECFKKDFNNWLDYMISIKGLEDVIGKENVEIVNKDSFNWIDDNKNDIKVNMTLKNN